MTSANQTRLASASSVPVLPRNYGRVVEQVPNIRCRVAITAPERRPLAKAERSDGTPPHRAHLLMIGQQTSCGLASTSTRNSPLATSLQPPRRPAPGVRQANLCCDGTIDVLR